MSPLFFCCVIHNAFAEIFYYIFITARHGDGKKSVVKGIYMTLS